MEELVVLSPRESEILELIADGQSAKLIARKIGISPRSAERYIENCKHKLGARNKAELVAKAMARGGSNPSLLIRDKGARRGRASTLPL
jgi:DNA-binding CsgD family transcriptional regulator